MMATLMGAVTFTACNNGDDEPVMNDKVAVQFAAGIGDNVATGTPGTRASGDQWVKDDKIGIFMVKNGTLDISESAENKKYIASAAGGSSTFAADDDANIIYYPSSGSVNFIAYHPWETGAVLGTPINVTIETAQTAGNQPEFDLLYTKDATPYSSTSPTTVPLAFDHKLSKLVMNLAAGSGARLSTVDVTIKGMYTKNTFNLGTGDFGTATEAADIVPRTITAGPAYAYDAIILPGDYTTGVSVVIGAGGETYTWNCGEIEFEPGKEHTYTITLSKGGGVTVTGEINPWITGTGGSVTATN